MTPYYSESGVKIYNADAMAALREMPDASIHCCVTSPPYWGLRDYGTAKWEGGDAGCGHKQESQHQKQGATSARAGRSNIEDQRNENFRGVCGKCGARRVDSQIGLEATPEAYVARMVEVFREVRRVLRDDGTLWLNLGDSYSRDPGKGGSGPNGKHDFIPDYGKARKVMRDGKDCDPKRGASANGQPLHVCAGLKAKDLVGIPWRVAFALQTNGWYLRSDIIWNKPNPMPESVTDRPTKAHEYLFLMAKSERYYYDADAVREPYAEAERYAYSFTTTGGKTGQAPKLPCMSSKQTLQKDGQERFRIGEGRNRRSVWTIATEPFPEAHFATFPQALIEPCIKAGCPAGGTVLDPFGGSGTTGLVAMRMGCKAVLIELNPDYAEMAANRLSQGVLDLGRKG